MLLDWNEILCFELTHLFFLKDRISFEKMKEITFLYFMTKSCAHAQKGQR